MTNYISHSAVLQRIIRKEMAVRLRGVCGFLTKEIKKDISKSGSKKSRVSNPGGKGHHYKTTLGVNRSKPFNPPFKQTGDLRRSMGWQVRRLVGRVGSDLVYARFLEAGTSKMAPRPFLRINLQRHRRQIAAMIGAPMNL